MTSEVPGTSGRKFNNDLAKVVPIDEFYTAKDVHNVSIQTGEEFSPEFLRDRISPRRVPLGNETDQREARRVGFNCDPKNQLVYEDLTGLLGIRRRDSESGTDVSEVEQKAYADTVSRYQRNYIPNDQQTRNFSDELSCDQGATRQMGCPFYTADSPQSCHRQGSGVSDGSLSGKMKFLCSFGGRILPRPNDGKLRYVGGETRIISIRKNLTYCELVKKTSAICAQTHTIKYQLPGEDLDALISVSSDEDLHHMIEEYQDLERGSQRLRIFLISYSSEAESPVSVESRSVQQNDIDYQYVVAVNGMLNPSPKRSSSGHSLSSQASHWDYSPTFQRDSPTSIQPLEIREGSSSPNLKLMLSNPATQFFTTTKSFNQSPPPSPVPIHSRDPKNTHMKMYEDRAFGDGHFYNQPQVPLPMLNYQNAYNKHLVESNKIRDMRFINHNPSKDFVVSSPLYGQSNMDFGRRNDRGLKGEKFISSPDDTMRLFPESDVPILSYNRMPHALSDPQLLREGDSDYDVEKKADITWYDQNFQMEKSPSLAMSNLSQEWQQQELIAEKQKSAENTIMPICKSRDNSAELIEWEQEMMNSMGKKGDPPGWDGKHCDGNGNLMWNPNAMEHQINNFPMNSIHTQQFVPEGKSADFKATALEDFTNTMRELVDDYRSNSSADEFLVKGQKASETMSSETTSDASPGEEPIVAIPLNLSGRSEEIDSLAIEEDPVKNLNGNDKEMIASQEQSFVASRIGDAVFVHSEQSDNLFEISESAVIVEDVTDVVPPEVPSPSTIVPLVEDDPSDENSSPRETDTESCAPESDYEDVKGRASNIDESISDAAIAEMEAGIYGLQIIRNDDLEELRELGSGTFGTVYHGKWRGTDVAIKRIKKSCFAGRSSEQERLTKDFWREAQILSKLHHPNVVAFYGVVPDGPGGTLATLTEFMANGSLRHVLLKKERRALDWRKKLIIAMDAAFGMEYLHLKNIVHFDLKCDNLLVNLGDPQRPVCKVGDFGLSRIKRNTLVSGGVRGTLPWMAPELLNGSSSRVSEKVDVFSFGITMWEILTAEEPYANMHCGAIIGGIVSNTLRPPVPDRCNAEWRTLMEDCWSPDPAARPSFTEIANRLRVMSIAVQPKRHNQAKR